MNVVHRKTCGIHLDEMGVFATIRTVTPQGNHVKLNRHFTINRSISSGTSDEIIRWLKSNSVEHIAIESIGNYWKSLWDCLENNFTLYLVHKNDIIQAQDIIMNKFSTCDISSKLLQRNQLKRKYIPDSSVRQLRELTRLRETAYQTQSILGCKLREIIEGSGVVISAYNSGIPANKLKLLKNINTFLPSRMTGFFGSKNRTSEHNKYRIMLITSEIRQTEKRIISLMKRIKKESSPHRETISNVIKIPGLFLRLAENILAETGFNLRRFSCVEEFIVWTGFESYSISMQFTDNDRIGKSSHKWLRKALSQAGISTINRRGSILQIKYQNHVSQYGPRKAIWITHYTILWMIYHIVNGYCSYTQLESFLKNNNPESLIIPDNTSVYHYINKKNISNIVS